MKKKTNHCISGPWPQPHSNKGHAQVGDAPDADYADSEDTKYILSPEIHHLFPANPFPRGPWPNAHSDKSHAQIGDADGQPIIAHNEDTKFV